MAKLAQIENGRLIQAKIDEDAYYAIKIHSLRTSDSIGKILSDLITANLPSPNQPAQPEITQGA